jgi:hypothetical protein
MLWNPSQLCRRQTGSCENVEVGYVCVACWWRQSAVAWVVPRNYGTGIKRKLGIDATFPSFVGAGDIQLEEDAIAIAITKTTE